MKLILCSDFNTIKIKDSCLELLNKSPELSKVLFVKFADEENNNYISSSLHELLLIGFKMENITMLEEGIPPQGLYDVIFVNGGNPIRLKDKLTVTGWFETIKKLVLEQNSLYIGESAGSVITGDDISHSLVNNQYYKELPDYNGFGFVATNFIVHHSQFRYSQSRKRLVENEDVKNVLEKRKILPKKWMGIGNNEYLLVDGKKMKKVKRTWAQIKELNK